MQLLFVSLGNLEVPRLQGVPLHNDGGGVDLSRRQLPLPPLLLLIHVRGAYDVVGAANVRLDSSSEPSNDETQLHGVRQKED